MRDGVRALDAVVENCKAVVEVAQGQRLRTSWHNIHIKRRVHARSKLDARSLSQNVEPPRRTRTTQVRPDRLAIVRDRHLTWLTADKDGWSWISGRRIELRNAVTVSTDTAGQTHVKRLSRFAVDQVGRR